ncbi:MAG: NYN domain-containing protein [Planctomycetota bacterium]|jgi:predicted RNA-binding protein with PIN domain
MPVIIDGYNLLHSIQNVSEGSGSIDDIQMCRIVGQYLGFVGEQGVVVFDGIGPPEKSGFYNIGNLEVIFSGQRSDADTVIEIKIKASTAPKRLRIVSSDRRLRDAARARKATVTKSEQFWYDIQKRLSRKKTKKEPSAKCRGISGSETRQWLKLFGLEQ